MNEETVRNLPQWVEKTLDHRFAMWDAHGKLVEQVSTVYKKCHATAASDRSGSLPETMDFAKQAHVSDRLLAKYRECTLAYRECDQQIRENGQTTEQLRREINQLTTQIEAKRKFKRNFIIIAVIVLVGVAFVLFSAQ